MPAENKIQIAINNTIPEIRAQYANDPNYVLTTIQYHNTTIELYTRRNRGSTYDGLIINLSNEPGMYTYTHYYSNRAQRPTSSHEHYSPDAYNDWLIMFERINQYNQQLLEPEPDFNELEVRLEAEPLGPDHWDELDLHEHILEVLDEMNEEVDDNVLDQIHHYIDEHPLDNEDNLDAYTDEIIERFL